MRADKGADLLVRWAGLYVLVTGALSWLTKNVSWFGELSWTEAVFIAFWLAIIAVFLCAASLALFRFFRPLPNSERPVTPPELGPGPSGYDDTELRAQLNSLASEIAAVDIRNRGYTTPWDGTQQTLDRVLEWLCATTFPFKPIINDITTQSEIQLRKLAWARLDTVEDRLLTYVSRDLDVEARQITEILEAMGRDPNSLNPKIQERIEDVQRNTDFILLGPNEQTRWASGAEKKDWHRRFAPFYVMQRELGARPGNEMESSRRLVTAMKSYHEFRKRTDEWLATKA